LSYLKNSYSLFSSLCWRWITFWIIDLSSAVKCDKSGLLGGGPPVVLPVDELPGPKPELVEAANPESDIPPPELPILEPKALNVAARLDIIAAAVVVLPELETGCRCWLLPVTGNPPGDDVIIMGGGSLPDGGGGVASTIVLVILVGVAVTTVLDREVGPGWLVVTACINMLFHMMP
jgi:hypothetical protein